MIVDKANQYPNRMGSIFIQAMEEILGKNGVEEILGQADLAPILARHSDGKEASFSFEHLDRLQSAFERAYGSRSGCGLALRVGRASFKYSLREFGDQLGLTDLAFRLLPLREKIKKGSEALAELINGSTGQNIRLERDDNTLLWQMNRCPECQCGKAEGGRSGSNDGLCCQLAVGLLQEALFWLSSGKFFEVQQVKSTACSDNGCKILINLSPTS
jgi:hypothetical protein